MGMFAMLGSIFVTAPLAIVPIAPLTASIPPDVTECAKALAAASASTSRPATALATAFAAARASFVDWGRTVGVGRAAGAAVSAYAGIAEAI